MFVGEYSYVFVLMCSCSSRLTHLGRYIRGRNPHPAPARPERRVERGCRLFVERGVRRGGADPRAQGPQRVGALARLGGGALSALLGQLRRRHQRLGHRRRQGPGLRAQRPLVCTRLLPLAFHLLLLASPIPVARSPNSLHPLLERTPTCIIAYVYYLLRVCS